MNLSLPSRYEDLDDAYRGRLVPDKALLDIVSSAEKSMKISGGIRFLPIYGESGSGKTSAAREIGTHLPDIKTFLLNRKEIESNESLIERINEERKRNDGKVLVAVIDQYEENVSERERIPTQFVEYLSHLDRGGLRKQPIIFLWLTTSREFQTLLAEATSRNKRILLRKDFSITGPTKQVWPQIIEETFSFHNSEKSLADYEIIDTDINEIAIDNDTIGSTIEGIGVKLGEFLESTQNLSDYQVILMWPVADGLRNQRVMQFAKSREGYRLNWDSFYNELNQEDKLQLPLRELNRARLYFDMRIIPVRAADLHRLCLKLDEKNVKLAKTYLGRFAKTHFYHVVSGSWDGYDYNPVRERESKRSEEAKDWYSTVTTNPTQLGKRISKILNETGLNSTYEKTLTSPYSSVRADVFVQTENEQKNKIIIELKAFSSENTMPSTIKEQIKITLKRHAQFAGLLPRQ
ncbi:MAG: ATP-binding protein [Candidatus Electrothrix sp. AW3_4]|jgi:ABC-type dipeptide/oligopeptide/nickel transport system ATPase component|nr:ATP-binding protein [Candidatus Electrothrix gigas]